MLLNFLDALRAAGIPASVKEHLVLLDALEKEVIERSPESFYYLARATYVKDEGLIDRFDQVFAKVFKGCLLYTSDAADERSSVDLGGRRIIKKKKDSEPA